MAMQKNKTHIWRCAWLLATLLYFIGVEASSSVWEEDGDPLVVVCSGNLPPYNIIDESGDVTGFTVDVLNVVFDKLDIPHAFMVSGDGHYGDIVVAPVDQLRQQELLLSTTVLGRSQMGEMRLGSRSQQLLNAIDDQYARLEQSGELSVLHDKWFHPERRHDNTSPIVLYIAVAAVLLVLMLSLVNTLVGRRVRRKTLKHSEQTRLMNLALDLGGYMVSEYNPRQDAFKNLRGQLMDEKTTRQEALDTVHPDDRQALEDQLYKLSTDSENNSDMLVRRKQDDDRPDQWQYLTGSCIKERDSESDHSTYLLVAKDITADMDEQKINNDMAVRYNKAFDMALVALSFYSRDGELLDMNERMKQVVGFEEANQQFFYETPLFEAPLFKEVLVPGMTEPIHACQHMYYPEYGLDKYLEYRIRPAYTDDGEIRYYVVTVLDISEERNLYLEQQLTERQLKVTTDEANRFEQQLNYLLSKSKMFIWRTNIDKQKVYVSRSLRKVDSTFSFDDYLNGLIPEERESAYETFFNPLMQNNSVNDVRHFYYSPLTKAENWFAISGMPYYGKNGKVKGHFGVIRDVSDLMRSQEELRRETIRAQESGKLKATFLANMTHEIRTPLNSIVGFSDLLQTAETPEERAEFIRIIRHNCDLLLRLIDDILETSAMSQRPQTIAVESIDFAVFFDEVCQTVAQRVNNPDVMFLKENPYKSFPARTDRERIQQVITNFVTNAVKYTTHGHIKVGYHSENDGIYIYCEDTGAGIPEEKQVLVFERFVKLNDFVQGTGLGLSICKSIAERLNGKIGVKSEGLGKGSTFWLWIPRYLTFNNLTEEK